MDNPQKLVKLEIHSYYVKVDLPRLEAVVIRRVRQRDGGWLWKIENADLAGGPVLNADFEWEYNSSPSNRDDDEIQRTRYASLEIATAHLERYLQQRADELMSAILNPGYFSGFF